MGRELDTPRESQEEVYADCGVVYIVVAEVSVGSETPGMLWVVAFGLGGEDREVPIFGDVPVEGVHGIQEEEE